MKRLLGLFLLTASSFAYAIPVTYTDVFDANPDVRLSSNGDNYLYTHDINDDGFNTSTDTVLSAMLTIDVRDDGDRDSSTTRYNRYTTWCGRHSRFGRYHCHYSYRSVTTPGQTELLQVSADDNGFGTHEIDYNPLGFNVNIANIQSDGLLNIVLSVIRGDLIFSDSTLVVNVDSVPVPEPGPLSLLGLGLAGLIFSRRKRRS